MENRQPLTFVLVHGAWHGGWCWVRVAEHLRARGYRVFTPTLTGLGERSHLLSKDITLSTHVTDVVNLLLWEELTEVVLCGHSYGGFVVTGVAGRINQALRAIVYLDTFFPEDGESLMSSLPLEYADVFQARTQDGICAPMEPGTMVTHARDREWVARRMTPHPAVCFEEPAAGADAVAQITRRFFVQASGINGASTAFEPSADKIRAAGGWRVMHIRGSHDLMIDSPIEVADMLVSAGE